MFPDYSILNRAYKHPGRTQVTNTYTLAPLLRSYTRTIYFTPYLHVDEGSAGEVLGGSERDEPEHGEAAVPELGVGGHEAAAPGLGALPLEQRRQRRRGQHDGGVREPREPGAVAGLREEAVPAGRLDGERGHETHHGEAPVDPLRRGAAERQRVPELGRGGRAFLSVLLGLRPGDERCAPARREPGRRKPGGDTAGARAGGGEGEGARGGGHHRGRHRERTHGPVNSVTGRRREKWQTSSCGRTDRWLYQACFCCWVHSLYLLRVLTD